MQMLHLSKMRELDKGLIFLRERLAMNNDMAQNIPKK